jgi:GNAT superfamily N-acetyltransferase
MTLVVRPIGEDDIERALEVRNAVIRREPMQVEAFRARLARPGRLNVLAELDGRLVGIGHASPDTWQPDSGYAYAGAAVLAEHRRRGTGTAILAAVSEHAAGLGAHGLTIQVAEDEPDALAYLGKRGYAEAGRMQYVTLPLDEADEQEIAVPGVEIAPLAEDHVDRLYAAAAEAEADIPAPGGGVVSVPTPEEWRRRALGQAFPRYEHSFVAIAGGEIVGYALLERLAEGIGVNAITAVRPAWRGRGIATALKRAQIASAKRAGLRELSAMNSMENPAMRRVNDRLGYRQQPAVLQLRGPLLL